MGGISSISLAVKSVSGAVELTQSLTSTVPVTSRSASSGRGPKHQHVAALGERQSIGGGVGVVARPLVVAAVGDQPLVRRDVAADRRHRMLRVEGVGRAALGERAGGVLESVPSAFR